MSDTKRAADSKSHRRGLESDGANPSDTPDVLDAIACEVGDTFIDCWHMAPTEQWRRIGDALASAGWVLVKADGLSHGDELVRVDGLRVTGTQDAPTFNQEPVWRRLRRSVPERRCSTCDGRKVVEGHAWRRIDETTGFPARELVPCPACSVPENGDTQ